MKLQAVLTLAAALIAQIPTSLQTYIKEPAPGITFRVDVESNPNRLTYAIKFDRAAMQYWHESALAVDQVYDLKPTNGRSTVSELVRDGGAIGGVNGDFFQFGRDPGGDPVGIMVRHGELVSHPGGDGNRSPSIGWGPGGVVIAPRCSWTAFAEFNGHALPIIGLNEYARPDGITLATSASGYAISKIPATHVVLKTSVSLLKPTGDVYGTVIQHTKGVEKLRVGPGRMVLMLTGDQKPPKLMDRVRISVKTEGYDWEKVDHVMGGGPVLIHPDGKLHQPRGEDPRHPRTAMGWDADGSLWYVLIDGRQTMSVGSSMKETAEIMKRIGCVQAINLDGGGSSAMNLYGLVLNRPSGGIERHVANGVLWHGPPPAGTNEFTLQGPESITVGQKSKLKLNIDAQDREVIWTAQGAAWITPDGQLIGSSVGDAKVSALYRGRIASMTVKVTQP